MMIERVPVAQFGKAENQAAPDKVFDSALDELRAEAKLEREELDEASLSDAARFLVTAAPGAPVQLVGERSDPDTDAADADADEEEAYNDVFTEES